MRPIINSESCTSLVDITDDLDKVGFGIENNRSEVELVESCILLPHSENELNETNQYLHLPASTVCRSKSSSSDCVPVDEYLNTISIVSESAERLLNESPVFLSSDCEKKVVNVCQGEIAHAVPSQCDVLVSDDATTCHIVAFRSTLGPVDGTTQPLTTLTHIDRAAYENCITQIIDVHKRHHFTNNQLNQQEDMVYMDLHVMGGFDDADGSSREISNFFMALFARITQQERGWLRLTLKTCAISSMNDDGFHSPIGRGLGIDLHSGESFLAAVDESVTGPALVLRQCRLWSGVAGKNLSVIHNVSDTSRRHESTIIVDPFKFKALRGMNVLLQLPDQVLLEYTSTSPQAERNDFCDNVRRTLRFMKDADWKDIFGHQCDRPVMFRKGFGNDWERI